MAINNGRSSVHYNDGGFLPDIILLTQCYYHNQSSSVNPIKCHNEFFSFRSLLCSHLTKRFDIFSLFCLCLGNAQKVVWIRSDFFFNGQDQSKGEHCVWCFGGWFWIKLKIFARSPPPILLKPLYCIMYTTLHYTVTQTLCI